MIKTKKLFITVILSLLPLISVAQTLWVDALNGQDQNDGLTASTALKTIQAAANLAQPGDTVNIQPGIYQESIKPANSGTEQAPITYQALNGKAILRGAVSAADLTWTALTENNLGLPDSIDPSNIMWADISAWQLKKAPRFIVQFDASGEPQQRLPLAREPDWSVQTDWKYHENWWAATGGHQAADCHPPTDDNKNCDKPSRSLTQLTDDADDQQPAGIEPGNLTTLGDLTGASVVAVDAFQGHYVYTRTITAHDTEKGTLTIEGKARHNTDANPGLGWGSKYYLKNHPALLDQPGEYWFDAQQQRLYLWFPDTAKENIWIANLDTAWNFRNRSHLILDGLTIELFNDHALEQRNYDNQVSQGNTLRHLKIRYANSGLFVEHVLAPDTPANIVSRHLLIENSEIAYMDTQAIYMAGWWADGAAFTHVPLTESTIRNNHIHHIGFYSDRDSAVGLAFGYADNLRFENNHVHHIAHNGIQFSWSAINSDKEYGYTPQEILTGDILVKDNLIEGACMLATDCGGLKFWGTTSPGRHVFRNVLITGNTVRDNYGWTFVSEQRSKWAQGFFANGIYSDFTSGLHIHRNLSYNNSWAGISIVHNWRDGAISVYNNTLVNNKFGIDIWNMDSVATHEPIGLEIINNLFVNNGNNGIQHTIFPEEQGVAIHHNLYYANGWMREVGGGVMRAVKKDENYQTINDLQEKTPWGEQSLNTDPRFAAFDYRLAISQRYQDEQLMDFQLTYPSTAINQGTELGTSLQKLLEHFDLQTWQKVGEQWDLGALEFTPKTEKGTAITLPQGKLMASEARFAGAIVTTQASGWVQTIDSETPIKLMTDIYPAEAHQGQAADIIVVLGYQLADELNWNAMMRTPQGWQTWSQDFQTLEPAYSVENLESHLQINVFEGKLPYFNGKMLVFTGYRLQEPSLFVFNGNSPLNLTVR